MPHIESELLEAGKAKNEILKWKLVVVGALAAVGAGLNKDTNAAWALALIPLLCLYVDLVYRNICLRVQVIESFLMSCPNPGLELAVTKEFVEFHHECQKEVRDMSLEAGAIVGSSVLFCFMVAVSPLLISKPAPDSFSTSTLFPFLVTLGVVGMVASLALESWYRRRDNALVAKGMRADG